MKSTHHTSEKNTINKYYLLMVLATSIGFAQTEKSTQDIVKAKSDLSSAAAITNPYFKENSMSGEITSVSDEITEPVQVLKTRTKSNQTNERTTRPNGQDDGNPFPQKSSVSNVLKTKHDTAKNSVGNIR
ncbi:hypothetical protein [Flavobacterium alvei]|jgi:hypothetical protein|uniref:hypothetical protein n=1 Tax=Flavobacterium alvei TaxID=2080416 RepID=UPI0026ED484B|nr:hypothetical protein [Flavobacterium alvei]